MSITVTLPLAEYQRLLREEERYRQAYFKETEVTDAICQWPLGTLIRRQGNGKWDFMGHDGCAQDDYDSFQEAVAAAIKWEVSEEADEARGEESERIAVLTKQIQAGHLAEPGTAYYELAQQVREAFGTDELADVREAVKQLRDRIEELENRHVNGVTHSLLNELSMLSDLPGSPTYAECIRRFIEEIPELRAKVGVPA